MIKRTLYFGSPAYCSVKDEQLVIKQPEERDMFGEERVTTAPIEDIGVVVLDHPRVTVSHRALELLLENNAAVITCDRRHLPVGLLLPLAGHHLQSERFRAQIDAPKPLRKRLWARTVSQKIHNQADLLEERGEDVGHLREWSRTVRSGDPKNLEAQAAVFYWKELFPADLDFRRDRHGDPPNNALNYGYAIVRASAARALVSSGLLPTLGIHHHNRYNAYCLADDVMEPYRPFVDAAVCELMEEGIDLNELGKEAKRRLLSLPTEAVFVNEERAPLAVALSRTAASLARCFEGEEETIVYPTFAFE